MPVDNKHIGSTLDELLTADGTLAEVTQNAEERVRAYEDAQIQDGGAAVHAPPAPKRAAFGRGFASKFQQTPE